MENVIAISNVDDDDDVEYEDVWWTIKMNNKNQIMPSTVVKFRTYKLTGKYGSHLLT